ncbi:Crp/Fnr family transcriptional regulator [Sediminitomix flava]|uniref:CRP-like cAMP-binding protein n=1 Tax=Sediminitomix flava TaxID=379075 RepID=A0A315ZNB7_SEDFL|nr:Crp/Fnr family transcriptional regulator [Sediminitomix flava]PWJ35999.1 CRP-like cAMP-binding protein [Sediminitomix flava]
MIHATSKLWYLENYSIIKSLPKSAQTVLEDISTTYSFKKNDFIYLNGDQTDTIYFLKEGTIKISSITENETEQTKSILKKGALFGELRIANIHGDGEDFVSVKSEKAILCKIDFSEVETLLEMYPNLSLSVKKLRSFQFKTYKNPLEQVIYKDPKSRIIDFILDFSKVYGHQSKDEVWSFKLIFSNSELAKLTASSPKAVKSILKELQNNGQIRIEKGYIYFEEKHLLLQTLLSELIH